MIGERRVDLVKSDLLSDLTPEIRDVHAVLEFCLASMAISKSC